MRFVLCLHRPIKIFSVIRLCIGVWLLIVFGVVSFWFRISFWQLVKDLPDELPAIPARVLKKEDPFVIAGIERQQLIGGSKPRDSMVDC